MENREVWIMQLSDYIVNKYFHKHEGKGTILFAHINCR